MLKLFCIPGRLLAKLFSREKKRAYRSVRSHPGYGPGIILVSLVCWLALAGGVLFAIDKAGLLKQALDVGVEVAQGGSEETDAQPNNPIADPPPAVPVTSGSATGGLSAEGRSSGLPPVVSGGETTVGSASVPAVETKQWLVILRSIKKDAKNSRGEAEMWKGRYRNKGLDVDIFDAGAFPLLDKSYWIVAQGPFEDRGQAITVAEKAKQVEPGLMIRQGL